MPIVQARKTTASIERPPNRSPGVPPETSGGAEKEHRAEDCAGGRGVAEPGQVRNQMHADPDSGCGKQNLGASDHPERSRPQRLTHLETGQILCDDSRASGTLRDVQKNQHQGNDYQKNRQRHRHVARAKSVLKDHIIREDADTRAAEWQSGEHDPERQPALLAKQIGYHHCAWNYRRCGDADAEHDEDHQERRSRIRAAECEITERHHRSARYHHVARTDAVEQRTDNRAAKPGRERRRSDQRREQSARPSEMLDDREEEHAARIHRPPDQEHRCEQYADDHPASLILPVHKFTAVTV